MSQFNSDAIKSFLNAQPSGKYASFKDRTLLPSSSTELSEKKYVEREYLELINNGRSFPLTVLNDNELVTKWQTISDNIVSGKVSERTIRQILECAYNLKAPDGTAPLVKPVVNQQNIVSQCPAAATDTIYGGDATTSGSLIVEPSTNAGSSGEMEDSKARAISYICCFMLRMAQKQPDHLNKSLDKVKAAYGSFYGGQSHLLNTWIPPMVLGTQLKKGFETYSALRYTLARMLGAADVSGTEGTPGYGLCRMLLFQHLEKSGMQIYSMVMQLIHRLKYITGEEFLEWVCVGESQEALNDVYTIGTTLDAPLGGKAMYWRYAKLTDPAYFINMSVKRNAFFGMLLAELMYTYGLAGKTEFSDPRKIKALEGLSTSQRASIQKIRAAFEALYAMREGSQSTGAGFAQLLASGRSPPTNTSGQQEEGHQAASMDTTSNEGEDLPPPPQAPGTSVPASGPASSRPNAESMTEEVLDRLVRGVEADQSVRV